MESLHVYRLLTISSQSVSIRIPPSLIYGYGFTTVTLLSGLPVKAQEGEISDLLKNFPPGVPFALLKTDIGVKVCGTLDEASQHCKELLKAKSKW